MNCEMLKNDNTRVCMCVRRRHGQTRFAHAPQLKPPISLLKRRKHCRIQGGGKGTEKEEGERERAREDKDEGQKERDGEQGIERESERKGARNLNQKQRQGS